MKIGKISTLGLAGAALAASLATLPAHALIADGLTYSLTETVNSATDILFTLNITGINAPGPTGDAEGGREAVTAFAFNGLGNGWNITGPSGWSRLSGQTSNSGSGCNSPGGGWFCFQQNTYGSSVLAANSSLSYSFELMGSGLSSWDPSFKINWIGTKNNYDLVSQTLTPGGTVAAPEVDPGTTLSGLTLLAGAMAILRGRRRRS